MQIAILHSSFFILHFPFGGSLLAKIAEKSYKSKNKILQIKKIYLAKLAEKSYKSITKSNKKRDAITALLLFISPEARQ